MTRCSICGEPMPAGEEMFKFHGYSGPCPKPPLPKRQTVWKAWVKLSDGPQGRSVEDVTLYDGAAKPGYVLGEIRVSE